MKRKVVAGMAALICAISILCAGVVGKADSIHEKELENYIIKEMSNAHILGMGISIVSSEKELYCAAYGATQETESDYVLASLSKSFTAAAIMHLKEEDELSLEDTVSDYLTGYDAVSDVTILELLHHTSGISAEERMSDLQAKGQKGVFEYANANYNLLGEIVEATSGLSYEEYVSDNILDPLEMTSTYSMRTGADLSENLLSGYQNLFGFPFTLKHQYDKDDDWIQAPSGYMISDAKDMGRYLQMYLNKGGNVLSEESVDAMFHQGVDMSSDRSMEDEFFKESSAEYGMGWISKQIAGQTILYHSGKIEGFTTMMVLLPEQDLGITMLFNSMDFLVGQNLIEQLEEGIVSFEMGNEPKQIDSHAYLLQHGIWDGVMLLLIILSWMPVFLMGIWWKGRCKKPLSPLGLTADIVIHIVLPTVLVVVLPGIVPAFMVKRLVPDVYYVLCAVIGVLYFGGVVKLLAGTVLALKEKKGSLSEREENKRVEPEQEEPKTEKLAQEEVQAQKEMLPEQEEMAQKVFEKKLPKKKEPGKMDLKLGNSGNKSSGRRRKSNRKKRN